MIGIVLAGGRATRLGGSDKGLLDLDGRTLLQRIMDCLSPQLDAIVINANGDPERFGALGAAAVVADTVSGHPGPLAGVLAGLDWVADHRPGDRFALTVPTDTPFLPDDLVARLAEAAAGKSAAIASSGGRLHHTTTVWSVALREPLRTAVTVEGVRTMRTFLLRCPHAAVEWPVGRFDPFQNINTEEDLRVAEGIAMSSERPGAS